MSPEMLSGFIVAVGAIVGVVIGSLVSFLIARQQFKATVISSNRQQWINTLRDSIADFQTKAKIATLEANLASHDAASAAADPEGFDEAMKTMRLLIYKIALLINPKETDHAELLSLLRKLWDFCVNGDTSDDESLEGLQSSITSTGQKILKREWERVKRGK